MDQGETATLPSGAPAFDHRNGAFMDIVEGWYSTPSGNYFWHRKQQRVLKLLKHHAARHPGKIAFVELGCGKASDLFYFRDRLLNETAQWEYTGVDAEPTLLEICRFKTSYYQANNVNFLSADLTKALPFADASVDFLYCSEVIEHLLDPEQLLTEIRRVLKPGGYLLLTTPNEPNVFQRTYWSRKRRQALKVELEALKNEHRTIQVNGSNVFILGHISLRTIRKWDETLSRCGFELADYERGAMVYGATPFHDQEWVMGLRFLAECILDLLPKSLTRNLSDQLIALYRKKP